MAMHQSRPKSMTECSGPECQGCASARCVAEGGSVGSGKNREDQEEGVFQSSYSKNRDHRGTSIAGESVRHGSKAGEAQAKNYHVNKLNELQTMKKPNLYAEGGRVYSGKQRSDNEKGVHHNDIGPDARTKTSSYAGNQVGWANRDSDPKELENAKKEHGRVLGDMRSMKKPNLYADGGRVKGVQDPYNKWHITEPGSTGESGGVSIAGHSLRTGGEWGKEGAKEDHRRGIREIKDMGKRDRTNLAEGGEVGESDEEGEHELRHAMSGELMDALDRKDHKGIMDALEACVLSIKGRHE